MIKEFQTWYSYSSLYFDIYILYLWFVSLCTMLLLLLPVGDVTKLCCNLDVFLFVLLTSIYADKGINWRDWFTEGCTQLVHFLADSVLLTNLLFAPSLARLLPNHWITGSGKKVMGVMKMIQSSAVHYVHPCLSLIPKYYSWRTIVYYSTTWNIGICLKCHAS